jgi:hypothetical protein
VSRSFYINLVIAAVSAPAVLFCIPNYQPLGKFSFFHKLAHLDWLGITLHASIYLTYLMAFTFGGAQWAWEDGRTITVLVMFGVTLVAFIFTQRYSVLTTREHRIYPVQFLRRRTFLILYATTACAASSLFVAVYVSFFLFLSLLSLLSGPSESLCLSPTKRLTSSPNSTFPFTSNSSTQTPLLPPLFASFP